MLPIYSLYVCTSPHCHQFPTQSITCQPFYSHDLTAFTSVLSHIVKQAWAGSALKNRDWEFRWIDWKRLNDGSSIITAGKWGELWDSNWNSDKAVFEAVCLSSDWTGERCLGAAIAKAVQRNGVSEDSSHGCSSQVQRIQTDIQACIECITGWRFKYFWHEAFNTFS